MILKHLSATNVRKPFHRPAVRAFVRNNWQERPSAQEVLQMSSREKKNATHDTLLLHHCGMETATPLSAQTQVPGIPSISQVSKTEACGSALAVPVKKYGSLQKAQQELQAVVSAMQAPLADFDSQAVAAQLGTGPLGPHGEPLTPHGNPPKPHCDAPQVNVHDSQSACRVHNLSSSLISTHWHQMHQYKANICRT